MTAWSASFRDQAMPEVSFDKSFAPAFPAMMAPPVVPTDENTPAAW